MCKQDVEIGRGLNGRSTVVTIAAGAVQKLVDARPDRRSVFVSIRPLNPATGADWIEVQQSATAGQSAVCVVPYNFPPQELRVDSWGVLVLGALYGYNPGTDQLDVIVTETFFTQTLEDV